MDGSASEPRAIRHSLTFSGRIHRACRERFIPMFHYHLSPDHPLRRFFSGIAEHTFASDLGVADPALIDYLSELLSRFISMDAIHRLKLSDQVSGRSLEQVADMLFEAEALPPEGRTY